MKKEKTFWIAVLAGFVVLAACDVLIHQVWLGKTYQELAAFWRPAAEMKEKMWLVFLSEFSLAFLLAVIFPLGHEKKPPVAEGIRFGLLMGLLIYLPAMLMKHYVYPYPTTLLAKWFVAGVAELTLTGTVISLAYSKRK